MAPSKLAWKIATRSSEMSVAPTERLIAQPDTNAAGVGLGALLVMSAFLVRDKRAKAGADISGGRWKSGSGTDPHSSWSELGDDPGICRLIVKWKGMEVSVSGHQPALSVSMSCLSSTASEPGCQAWLTYG